MKNQVQFFQIANLIFTIPENETSSVNGAEIAEIQKRFQNIVNSFTQIETTQYATNYVKQGGSNLPYSSMTIIGQIHEHLILHFSLSYDKPMMFIIDTQQNKVRNYIDIESAKGILQDDIYMDIKEALSYPKRLDRLFKGINDINNFVDDFQTVLDKHDNPNTITGYECFEIDLDDPSDLGDD